MQRLSCRFLFPIIFALFLLAGCQSRPEQKAAKYLDFGKKFAATGDHSRAILTFKNASKAMPKAAEPHYQMGLSYLALEDPIDAITEFNETIRLDENHLEAQLKVVDLMIASGQKDVLELAEVRANEMVTRFPGNADVLQARAAVKLGLNKLADAGQDAQQALARQPMHPRAMLTLALLKLSNNDVSSAEQLLKESFQHNPNSAETATSLGKLYLLVGKLPEAERWFQTAVGIDKKFAPALLGLGTTEIRLGNRQAAEDAYKRASELSSNSLKPAHAWFLANTGRANSALAELEELFQKDPRNRTVRTQLVDAYVKANRKEDAAKILTKALDKNARDTDARLQRAQLYLESGKAAEAQSDLLSVLAYLPKSADAHYLLARTYQGRGQISNQERELNEALQLNPRLLAARDDLGKLLLSSKRAQAALQLVNSAPEDQGRALPLVLTRNWALLALGDVAEARARINGALSQAKLPDLLVQDGVLKLKQGDAAGARAAFEAALQQSPEDIRALDGIAGSYLAQKQPAKALARIREAAALRPESGAVQRYLGEFLFRTGDLEGSRSALLAAKAISPKERPVDLALARVEIATGNVNAAKQRLMALAGDGSDDASPCLMLGMLEERAGKNEAAIEWYRKAVKINTADIVALNNLAYRLAESPATLDEALAYGQQAKQLAQDSTSAVDDTLGWIYYRKGLYRTAVTYLEAAAGREPTALRKYHLAMAYFAAGTERQAKQTLAEALKMDPSLAEAQQARQLFAEGRRDESGPRRNN